MPKDDKKPNSVLLVDDDEFIRDIYSTKFAESGIHIAVTEDGEEALDTLKEEHFDVILVDIIMPKVDGIELLEKLDERENMEDTKVIVLSNQGQPRDIDKAKEFDIDGYVIKANHVPSEVLDEITRVYNQ